jgi:predicted RNA-binding protein YlqC (UPF0109 family)
LLEEKATRNLTTEMVKLNEKIAKVSETTGQQTEKIVEISEATKDQTEEIGKQGKSIMVFTITTVIFVSSPSA